VLGRFTTWIVRCLDVGMRLRLSVIVFTGFMRILFAKNAMKRSIDIPILIPVGVAGPVIVMGGVMMIDRSISEIKKAYDDGIKDGFVVGFFSFPAVVCFMSLIGYAIKTVSRCV